MELPSVSIRNACCSAGSGMLDAWRTRTRRTDLPDARTWHSSMSSATSETSCTTAASGRLGPRPRCDEFGQGVDDARDRGFQRR